MSGVLVQIVGSEEAAAFARALRQALRGRGLGSSMLLRAEETARGRGCTRSFLRTP